MKVLAIYRQTRFSPNSVEKDASIIEAVGNKLTKKGHKVSYVKEDELIDIESPDLILTMGREKRTLEVLKKKEQEGIKVINSPKSIIACQRSNVDYLMRTNSIPTAPKEGEDGFWIKRGDMAAQEINDVVFVASNREKEKTIKEFSKRGITNITITAHVKGDCLKFYGVLSTNFFWYFYPTDFGDTKFGNEKINGRASHFEFSLESLKKDVEKLALLTGTYIYGGDCIIRQDGSYAIIDFNDWPSFSRCKEEAASAIEMLVFQDKHLVEKK